METRACWFLFLFPSSFLKSFILNSAHSSFLLPLPFCPGPLQNSPGAAYSVVKRIAAFPPLHFSCFVPVVPVTCSVCTPQGKQRLRERTLLPRTSVATLEEKAGESPANHMSEAKHLEHAARKRPKSHPCLFVTNRNPRLNHQEKFFSFWNKEMTEESPRVHWKPLKNCFKQPS